MTTRLDRRTIRRLLTTGHLDIPTSTDPTTGLQPEPTEANEHWRYRHGRPVKPAGYVNPYALGRSADLRATRETADPKPPTCTSCGAHLDAQWCENVRPQDRQDGYTYTAPVDGAEDEFGPVLQSPEERDGAAPARYTLGRGTLRTDGTL